MALMRASDVSQLERRMSRPAAKKCREGSHANPAGSKNPDGRGLPVRWLHPPRLRRCGPPPPPAALIGGSEISAPQSVRAGRLQGRLFRRRRVLWDPPPPATPLTPPRSSSNSARLRAVRAVLALSALSRAEGSAAVNSISLRASRSSRHQLPLERPAPEWKGA